LVPAPPRRAPPPHAAGPRQDDDCRAHAACAHPLCRRGAFPGQGVEYLSAGPAWEEGAEWIFGGVAFQSWSMDGCCSEPANRCLTLEMHDPPACFDYTHSETFLFRLAPGQPQRYGARHHQSTTSLSHSLGSANPASASMPDGWNHYRTVGPAWWPGFGYGPDLSLGNRDLGFCDATTFEGVQNELCGGHDNWDGKVLEVWRLS
jgi:hypothetical protein